MQEIEGESGAERRKRIKALRAGGEKFASLTKKDGGRDGDDSEETWEDKEIDIGPGPEPQWEEIKTCRAQNMADLTCIKLGDENVVDPSCELPNVIKRAGRGSR